MFSLILEQRSELCNFSENHYNFLNCIKLCANFAPISTVNYVSENVESVSSDLRAGIFNPAHIMDSIFEYLHSALFSISQLITFRESVDISLTNDADFILPDILSLKKIFDNLSGSFVELQKIYKAIPIRVIYIPWSLIKIAVDSCLDSINSNLSILRDISCSQPFNLLMLNIVNNGTTFLESIKTKIHCQEINSSAETTELYVDLDNVVNQVQLEIQCLHKISVPQAIESQVESVIEVDILENQNDLISPDSISKEHAHFVQLYSSSRIAEVSKSVSNLLRRLAAFQNNGFNMIFMESAIFNLLPLLHQLHLSYSQYI